MTMDIDADERPTRKMLLRKRDGGATGPSDSVHAPPFGLNMALSGIVILAWIAQLFLVPLLLARETPPLAPIILLLLAVLATPLHWALLHEAVHGRLVDGANRNRAFGRLLAGLSGVGFEVVRFGHLMHHRFTRHPLDRPDVLEPDAPQIQGWLLHYAHLLGGVYVMEIVATLALALPRRMGARLIAQAFGGDEIPLEALRSAALRFYADRARLARSRTDLIAAACVYAASLWLYGDAWPLLFATVMARGVIISLIDNAPHYGTPAVLGAPAGDFRLPGWAAKAFLHQQLHETHHRRPDLAWTQLPAAFAARNVADQGGYMRAVFRQFLGPRPPRS